jgi:hypothetical protein
VDGNCWCEGEYSLSLPPLDLYFILDSSGSMSGTNMTALKNGVTDYAEDANAAGTFVAGQEFPIDEAYSCPAWQSGTCYRDSCVDSQYATPARNWSVLPYPSFVTWVDGLSADGNSTTTGSALQGAVDACTARLAAQPTHKCAVVLVTDGDPNECSPTDANGLGAIAAAAYGAGIPVFAVGFPGLSSTGQSIMNKIAEDGGTDSGGDPKYIEISGGSMGSDFTDALKQIQEDAVGCEFVIPDFSTDELNPDEAKVVFTPSGGGPAEEYGKVDDAGACTGMQFYYDDNLDPSRAIMCPDLCSYVLADDGAQVTIQMDCAEFQ